VDFGTVEMQRQKRSVLIDFVATLARLLNRLGNRMGVVCYDGCHQRTIPMGSGRVHVLRIINDLLRYPHLTKAPFTDLTPLFETALATFKRRSLILVVSDFISAPGWERPLHLLNRRHEVLAVRLWDPREMTLPDLGLVMMEDAGGSSRVDLQACKLGTGRRFTTS
jgi:hypothetical protein